MSKKMNLNESIDKLIEQHKPDIFMEYFEERVENHEMYLSATNYLFMPVNADGSKNHPLDVSLAIDDCAFSNPRILECNIEEDIMGYIEDDPERYRENALVMAEHFKALSEKIIKAVS